jgi:catechol 2,3-dioxygenase-like lactoylglutathione lyase family enzyme
MYRDLFAGLPVSDYPRAVAWCERLFGAPATFEAHATECVWDLADQRSVYVVLRPDRAGGALLMFMVDDLDAFVAAAAERGVEPVVDETYGNGVRKATYRDPDGNEVGFGMMPG